MASSLPTLENTWDQSWVWAGHPSHLSSNSKKSKWSIRKYPILVVCWENDRKFSTRQNGKQAIEESCKMCVVKLTFTFLGEGSSIIAFELNYNTTGFFSLLATWWVSSRHSHSCCPLCSPLTKASSWSSSRNPSFSLSLFSPLVHRHSQLGFSFNVIFWETINLRKSECLSLPFRLRWDNPWQLGRDILQLSYYCDICYKICRLSRRGALQLFHC